MVEPIFKYQYLIDRILRNWNYIESNDPNLIYILLKNPKYININYYYLSNNIHAIKILEKNIDKINWNSISSNPNAIKIIENNLDKVVWSQLSQNINAIHIIEQNLDKVDWECLSFNVNAVHLLEKNLDKVNWDFLSTNYNAVHLLEKNPDKIVWSWVIGHSQDITQLQTINPLSTRQIHPNFYPLIEKYIDKINNTEIDQTNLYTLSRNPDTVSILEKNPHKICWEGLSRNPNAIHLIENNMDKISWWGLCHNVNAIHIIEKKFDYLYDKRYKTVSGLSGDELEIYQIIVDNISKNSNAINLIKKYINVIRLYDLGFNINGLSLLTEIFDKDNHKTSELRDRLANKPFYNDDYYSNAPISNYHRLCLNPTLLELDYIKMAKQRSRIIYSELIEKALAPHRVNKYLEYHLEQGYDINDFTF